MNVISWFQDGDYCIATIQIKENLFADVKAKSSGLMYIMSCEDGQLFFDADGRSCNASVDTDLVLHYFARWLKKNTCLHWPICVTP